MAGSQTVPIRLRRRFPAWVEAITYALVVGLLLTILALVITLITGGDLIRVKILLFFVGWGLLALSIVRLWPGRGKMEAAADDGDRPIRPVKSSGRLHRLTRRLPPARWSREPAPPERISTGGKQFLAALVTLAISFLLETGFGVG